MTPTPGSGEGDLQQNFVIHLNVICSMTMFWKNLTGMGGGGGSADKTFAPCVAVFVIPFNLICNVTMFWNSWILTPTPGSGVLSVGRVYSNIRKEVEVEGSLGKMFATMLLYSWFTLIWYATWHCSKKVEFWHFDP